jgi:hypothetical protein
LGHVVVDTFVKKRISANSKLYKILEQYDHGNENLNSYMFSKNVHFNMFIQLIIFQIYQNKILIPKFTIGYQNVIHT